MFRSRGLASAAKDLLPSAGRRDRKQPLIHDRDEPEKVGGTLKFSRACAELSRIRSHLSSSPHATRVIFYLVYVSSFSYLFLYWLTSEPLLWDNCFDNIPTDHLQEDSTFSASANHVRETAANVTANPSLSNEHPMIFGHDNLTTLLLLSEPATCSKGFVRMKDVHRPDSQLLKSPNQHIPRIVFQTAKSRCIPPGMHKRIEKTWKAVTRIEQKRAAGKTGGGNWSYYFYDDAAAMRLLQDESFDEFPLLKQVTQHCIFAGAVLADLWRYLVLYKYGGIYADIDTGFNTETFEMESILDYDAWMTVDIAYLPSQYFIAVSPRHPLMFYAIYHCLAALTYAMDSGTMHIAHGSKWH